MDRLDDFYNQLLLGFTMPDRMFVGKPKKTKFAQSTLNLTRNGIMSADRFFVHDELLEEAVKMSMLPPKKLVELIGFARPCMNNMWIEWNETLRVKLLHKQYLERFKALGIEDKLEPLEEQTLAEKCGYHIWQLASYYDHTDALNVPNSPQRKYRHSSFSEMGYYYNSYSTIQGKIMFTPMSYYLSLEPMTTKELLSDHTAFGNRGHSTRKKDMEDHDKVRIQCALKGFGSTYWKIHEKIATRYMVKIAELMSVSFHEMVYSWFSEEYMQNNIQQNFTGSSDSMNGDMRFIVALNCLINYPHFVIQKESPKVYQPRTMYGRRMPRNEMRILTLELPKPHGVTYYTRKFKNVGSPKRRHKRRGHDRYMKLKDGTVVKKWIEEQWVGNEELGTIFHEYDLKKNVKRKEG